MALVAGSALVMFAVALSVESVVAPVELFVVTVDAVAAVAAEAAAVAAAVTAAEAVEAAR